MCLQVAWTAGCSFDSAAEANQAAAAQLTKLGASPVGCTSVLFTAGCSFDSAVDAMAAAKPYLDAAAAKSTETCGNVMFTVVCTA